VPDMAHPTAPHLRTGSAVTPLVGWLSSPQSVAPASGAVGAGGRLAFFVAGDSYLFDFRNQPGARVAPGGTGWQLWVRELPADFAARLSAGDRPLLKLRPGFYPDVSGAGVSRWPIGWR
jgi:hypothetical protein